MPLFLIERNFAEQIDFTTDSVREVTEINQDIGVHWLFSFLSADKKKTYCLYEASDSEAIREAARRTGRRDRRGQRDKSHGICLNGARRGLTARR